ncbi:uncharacterized protein PHACADRAFT_246692 [Phanerochaete carnosa HHB-10118-sp]|uniref:LysM domain-containing protein n=1 Tax=Phanerochaete carnosa (strain HHB-10118-sp) TaxID=650164 RepID=K5XCD3_PHACS|nr:uncharacterized protein PHACADRAFT_246692 [Phanerochaete carnosa HHB-10118-sp]EKM60652.1 hypothetical protein PHACADRAFT_246692 [Phanerochaete carnosa HHB-10118-sp]
MFSSAQLIVLATFAAVSAVRAQTLPANCARNYTVQAGDTCNTIEAAQHVSTFQLTHVNTDIDAACDNLFVGEALCLGITGQDCTSVHVVANGDTCTIISNEADITTTTLLANNPNVNSGCSNLLVGEVLCTDSQIINYT